MAEKYDVLFKSIVKALNENNFDTYVTELMQKPDVDKAKLAKAVSALCGVDLGYSDKFVSDLKAAVADYKPEHKVVSKISTCAGDCGPGVPNCMKSCPFDAIIMNKDTSNAEIDLNKCTDCGFCVDACPTGSIIDKVEFLPLFELIKSKTPVIAAVAPAISGQYGEGVTVDMLRTAFYKLGFREMVEVAFFADMLTLKESIEFDNLVKKEDDLMITSCCCPMWVGMLKRVYDNLVRHVSPSVSPMIAAGRILKQLDPDCKVVFVGPCVAKKAEAKEKDLLGAIDFVLTFTELKEIFEAMDIEPGNMEETPSTDYATKGGKLYARAGGVSIAVEESLGKIFPEKHKYFKAVAANGVKGCREILEKAQNKEVDANFIEGMGCIGGCVGGPKALVSKEAGKESVDKYAEASSTKVSVDSQCIKDIFRKIGITSIEDLNKSEKIEIFERKF
ncbi:MAG: [Fe-Fe] hydrogenase large subunit C-terminal domain-containing protein [Clostridiaceae bacterium]